MPVRLEHQGEAVPVRGELHVNTPLQEAVAKAESRLNALMGLEPGEPGVNLIEGDEQLRPLFVGLAVDGPEAGEYVRYCEERVRMAIQVGMMRPEQAIRGELLRTLLAGLLTEDDAPLLPADADTPTATMLDRWLADAQLELPAAPRVPVYSEDGPWASWETFVADMASRAIEVNSARELAYAERRRPPKVRRRPVPGLLGGCRDCTGTGTTGYNPCDRCWGTGLERYVR